MILTSLLCAFLTCSVPAWTASGRMRLPKSSPKAENRLRSWLDQNVRLRQKLGQIKPTDSQAMAASRPEPAPAFADRDLKDAVADNVAPYDRERERAGLLA